MTPTPRTRTAKTHVFAQPPLVLAFDPVEHFIECRRVGDQSELGEEELLQ